MHLLGCWGGVMCIRWLAWSAISCTFHEGFICGRCASAFSFSVLLCTYMHWTFSIFSFLIYIFNLLIHCFVKHAAKKRLLVFLSLVAQFVLLLTQTRKNPFRKLALADIKVSSYQNNYPCFYIFHLISTTLMAFHQMLFRAVMLLDFSSFHHLKSVR